jgi:MFS family permease
VEPALLGLIAASFAVVPLFIAVLVGRAADAGRQRSVLLGGAVLMVAAGVGLVFWSSSLALLLVWNVVLGLGHLMGVIGTAEQDRRGRVGAPRFGVRALHLCGFRRAGRGPL